MSTADAVRPTVLAPVDLEEYQEKGYLIVRNVFSPLEIAAVVLEAERLLERRDLIHTDNIRCRWQPHVVTDECLFETFDPVVDIGPICSRLATDPRLLNVLADVYGEPAHLFKDKLIFKPPGAKGYDLHQDYIAWKDFPRSFVTVLVPIDPANRANGCTEVFPGYHRGGCLSPEDGDYHPLLPETVDESKAVPLELEPGDIALFGAFTPHRSAPNRSAGWRRQLYLSYNAASDGGDRRAAHYREFHDWLKVKYAEYGKHQVYFK
jgi:ectoine hydroxylase-related dioxygenase (phytanoyl-CoA dioxygenase family)